MTINWLPKPLLTLWHFLSTYVLTLQRFDLLLQGALLILVLLDSNVTLLLKRDAAKGHVPGNIHDWVSVGAAVLEFALGALLAWWGQARRHLALSTWLAAAAAAGLLVMAFPYDESIELPVDLCYSQEVSDVSVTPHRDPMATPRIVMLVITAGFCALGRLSVWAHGLTYLDDHEPENGPYFYGILITIRLSLGLNGVTWLTPVSIRQDWWEAHLSICMLTLMFAILFTLFPARMDKYKLVDDEMIDRGFLATMERVVRNKTVLLQTTALSFLYAAVFSFIRFDADYVQAVFQVETVRQDPRTSRAITDIFRSLVIIFFVTIFRTRFSVRRADGVKASTAARVGGVVAVMVALPLAAIALLRCSAEQLGDPACEAVQDCHCDAGSHGFSPVCDLNSSVTFFSPCCAGCRSVEDLNGFLVFTDCAGGGRAARGACALPACLAVFNVYQVLFAVMLAFAGAALLMQGMVLLRSVLTSDKAAAIGTSFAAIALLSHVPGYLVYMLISHLTCVHQSNSACVLHSPAVWSMAALSAGLSVVSGLLSLLASRL